MTQIDLSIIDTQCTRHFGFLCRHVDRLGFKRIWSTEHHTARQSASPLLLAAIAGATTKHLRIGTAGVMLDYTTPFKLAEDIQLLETMYPGRVDCGVIVGGKARPERHRELLAASDPAACGLPRFLKFLALLTRQPAGQTPIPAPGPVLADKFPPVWLCATSLRSARLAAETDAGLLFHHYLSKLQIDGRIVLSEYRDKSASTKRAGASNPIVAVYGMCADTDALAQLHWQAKVAPDFIGTPRQCVEQLREVAERYEVNELIIQCPTRKFQVKKRAYELLAGEAGLRPPT